MWKSGKKHSHEIDRQREGEREWMYSRILHGQPETYIAYIVYGARMRTMAGYGMGYTRHGYL